MKCLWQCENDPYAIRVLEKRWPGVKRYGDIEQIDWKEVERPDLIAGGFPCQDISVAGKGDGLDGEKSRLFFSFIDCLSVLRPGDAILENVSAILVRGVDRVLGALAKIGYDAEWHCIPAAVFNPDHERDRIFIHAFAQGTGRQIPLRFNFGDGTQKVGPRCRASRTLDTRLSIFHRFEERVGKPAVFGVDDGTANRVDRLRCVGNAVDPRITERIARSILEWRAQV